MKQYKTVKNLLSKGSTNTKTAKNDIKTFILYLAPHNLNIKNKTLCAFASKGCIDSCLYTAGMGIFSNVQNARINKANYFVTDKIAFLTQLLKEIKKTKPIQEKHLNMVLKKLFVDIMKLILKLFRSSHFITLFYLKHCF